MPERAPGAARGERAGGVKSCGGDRSCGGAPGGRNEGGMIVGGLGVDCRGRREDSDAGAGRATMIEGGAKDENGGAWSATSAGGEAGCVERRGWGVRASCGGNGVASRAWFGGGDVISGDSSTERVTSPCSMVSWTDPMCSRRAPATCTGTCAVTRLPSRKVPLVEPRSTYSACWSSNRISACLCDTNAMSSCNSLSGPRPIRTGERRNSVRRAGPLMSSTITTSGGTRRE